MGTPQTEAPKGVVTIKNLPDGPQKFWTQESRDEINELITEHDFIQIHIVKALEFCPMSVNVTDIVTVEDYS